MCLQAWMLVAAKINASVHAHVCHHSTRRVTRISQLHCKILRAKSKYWMCHRKYPSCNILALRCAIGTIPVATSLGAYPMSLPNEQWPPHAHPHQGALPPRGLTAIFLQAALQTGAVLPLARRRLGFPGIVVLG